MEKLLVTRKEAARLLSISVDKLDDLRDSRRIQCIYIGARCYYSIQELRAFLLKASKV
jgi:hypothetical protein